jgi:hypothetical protein
LAPWTQPLPRVHSSSSASSVSARLIDTFDISRIAPPRGPVRYFPSARSSAIRARWATSCAA